MPDDKFLTDEELEQVDGGKAIARGELEGEATIEVAPPGHQDGGAPGQTDHVIDPPTPL